MEEGRRGGGRMVWHSERVSPSSLVLATSLTGGVGAERQLVTLNLASGGDLCMAVCSLLVGVFMNLVFKNSES